MVSTGKTFLLFSLEPSSSGFCCQYLSRLPSTSRCAVQRCSRSLPRWEPAAPATAGCTLLLHPAAGHPPASSPFFSGCSHLHTPFLLFVLFVCLFYFRAFPLNLFFFPSPYPYIVISHVVSDYKYKFQTSISDCLLEIIWIFNFISNLVSPKPDSSDRIPMPAYSDSAFQLLRIKTFHGFNPLGS